MFTGIVEAVGKIVRVTPVAEAAGGVHLEVDADGLDCTDIDVGDSIALNGACLTVVTRNGNLLNFDASAETLRCTVGLGAPGPVNLEKALRFGDRLGGHLVAGHVDGVATVARFDAVGESRLLEVEAPSELARYIVVKGSIAIDGVSLTVNEVKGTRFMVNLIPHTLAVTTLGVVQTGQRVNLEIDMIARYLQKLAETGVGPASGM